VGIGNIDVLTNEFIGFHRDLQFDGKDIFGIIIGYNIDNGDITSGVIKCCWNIPQQ